MSGRLILNGQAVLVPFATRDRRGCVKVYPRGGRDICQIILHHDVCTSAESCIRILQKRGLGTHFVIDNDGTVVQLADPQDRVSHCRGDYLKQKDKSYNWRAIGIDISNVVLPKYAGGYTIPREQATVEVHGQPITGLLPYPCQVDACLALVRVLADYYQIPLTTRTTTDWRGDITPWTPGIWGHLHVAKGKIDPFGFPFVRLTEAK